MPSATTTEAPSSSSSKPSHLDTLLAAYLGVLDEYVTLRAQVGGAFSEAFLLLAQSRFRAPSSMGYMGFSSVLVDGGRRGRVPRLAIDVDDVDGVDGGGVGGDATPQMQMHVTRRAANDKKDKAKKEDEDEKEPEPVNPLRLFGFTPPAGLREAQGQFESAIDHAVQLVEVQRRLLGLEGAIKAEKKKSGK